MSGNGALVGSISPQATPDEVAAIVAAIGTCSFSTAVPDRPDDTLHEWVNTARLRSRRVGVQRGPWRFSGRSGRRSRV